MLCSVTTDALHMSRQLHLVVGRHNGDVLAQDHNHTVKLAFARLLP